MGEDGRGQSPFRHSINLTRIKIQPTRLMILITSFSSCSASLRSFFIMSSMFSPPFYIFIIHDIVYNVKGFPIIFLESWHLLKQKRVYIDIVGIKGTGFLRFSSFLTSFLFHLYQDAGRPWLKPAIPSTPQAAEIWCNSRGAVRLR